MATVWLEYGICYSSGCLDVVCKQDDSVFPPHWALSRLYDVNGTGCVTPLRGYTHNVTELFIEHRLVLSHFFYLCEIINKINNDRPNYRFQ